jgi:hypothetical protein
MSRERMKHSFSVGDAVRISLNRATFSKAYRENFSEAIYKIKSLIPSHPPRYELEDLLGNHLKGSFYEQELVKIDFDPDRTYKIDKIVGRRNRGRQVLVRWYGYDPKFDTWLDAKEVKKYAGQNVKEKKKKTK